MVDDEDNAARHLDRLAGVLFADGIGSKDTAIDFLGWKLCCTLSTVNVQSGVIIFDLAVGLSGAFLCSLSSCPLCPALSCHLLLLLSFFVGVSLCCPVKDNIFFVWQEACSVVM